MEVNDSHGAVEVNALQQATAINVRGVYMVGKIAGKQPQVKLGYYNFHILRSIICTHYYG